MINGISDRGLWGSKTDFRSVGVYKMKGQKKMNITDVRVRKVAKEGK